MYDFQLEAYIIKAENSAKLGHNPSLSATQMKNESDRARFFVYRHMDINLLNGNVLRYKKESCSATSSFWVAQDARGRAVDYAEIPLSWVPAKHQLCGKRRNGDKPNSHREFIFVSQFRRGVLESLSCSSLLASLSLSRRAFFLKF